jgi:hypothetical protein
MANNYTEMSVSIGREWAKEWKKDLVGIIGAIDSYDLDMAPEWFRAEAGKEITEKGYTGDVAFAEYVSEELCGSSGAVTRLEDDTLYIFHEESIQLEAIIFAIEKVMVHYSIADEVLLQYADTCSKPRTDEFGGGAVAVSKDGIRSWHTSQGVPPVTTPPADKAEQAEFAGHVGRFFSISMNHITTCDVEILETAANEEASDIIVYKQPLCYFVRLPKRETDAEKFPETLSGREFSFAFRKIVTIASESGCEWLLLDMNAEVSEHLPNFL